MSSVADLILAYATTPDLATAEKIARTLLNENLIACANFWPGMKSIYRWQGKVEESQETVLILKTRKSLWEKLSQRYVELHPYDTPCLLELELTRGHAGYVNWMLQETSFGGSKS